MDDDTRSGARLTLDVVERCRPLLAGHHPAIQGAVLADLLAMWLAGHPAEERLGLLRMHVASVKELIPINALIIRGEPVAATPAGA